MNQFIEDNWFKIGFLFITLFAVLLVGYYFVIYQPKYNKERLSEQQAKDFQSNMDEINAKDESAKLLQGCLDEADINYTSAWDATCITNGDKAGCGLYSGQTTILENRKENDKQNCFKQYPQS